MVAKALLVLGLFMSFIDAQFVPPTNPCRGLNENACIDNCECGWCEYYERYSQKNSFRDSKCLSYEDVQKCQQNDGKFSTDFDINKCHGTKLSIVALTITMTVILSIIVVLLGVVCLIIFCCGVVECYRNVSSSLDAPFDKL